MAMTEFSVGKEKITIDLDKLLEIDEDNLSNEYAQQAALYARFAFLLAEAETEHSMSDLAKDRLYADLDYSVRYDLSRSGEKFTEAVVKSYIITDESYIIASEKEILEMLNFKRLKAVVDALKMRADMLVSMGAHLRAEYNQTGMNIRQYDEVTQMAKETIRNIDRKKSK